MYLEESRTTVAFAARAKRVKIRILQNQLALEHSGQVQHQLSELEQQVESAETAAKDAEDKLDRFQHFLAHSGALFSEPKQGKRQKRRHSNSEIYRIQSAWKEVDVSKPHHTVPKDEEKGIRAEKRRG
jgi:hypothetical protein